MGCAVAVATVCALSAAFAQEQPGRGSEWRIRVKINQIATSQITADNTCHKRHRFEVDTQSVPSFMHLLGDSRILVDSHHKHDFPVQFSSQGLDPGEHQGLVVIRCLTCRQEKGCTVDRELLHITMTVEGEVQETQGCGASERVQFVPKRVLVLVPFDSEAGVKATAEKLASAYALKVEQTSRLESLSAALIVYSLVDGTDVAAKVAELGPHVLLAQQDFLYDNCGGNSQQPDPALQLQYGPALIEADRLRGIVTGKGVRVALIDTGLDANHPAIQGKITEKKDLTGQGFSPDIHATLLAGIIAAGTTRDTSVWGIAPQSEILAIKACQPRSPQAIQAQCWSLTLAQGMDYAVQRNADIINLSLSGPTGVEDKLITRLVDQAVGRGIVVIAAAGNSGPHGQPAFPAVLPNVIAVTAVDSKEQLYSSATRGDFIDLSAPGVEIISTGPGGKLLVASGTSLAAAFVTGTAALVLQQQPRISPQALQALLEHTAKDLGPPGKDSQFGSGLVDACHAIAQLKGDPKLCR
jgi:subtilisin family serine protease